MDDQSMEDEDILFTCKICSKAFKKKKYLQQHLNTHMVKRKCGYCDKTYGKLQDLRVHERRIHKIREPSKTSGSPCDLCGKIFKTQKYVKMHKRRIHKESAGNSVFICRHCPSEFLNYEQLFAHVVEHHPLQQGGQRPSPTADDDFKQNEVRPNENASSNSTDVSALENIREDNYSNSYEGGIREQLPAEGVQEDEAIDRGVVNGTIYPKENERYDLLVFFANVRSQIRRNIERRAREMGGIKWNLCVQVEMQRDDGGNVTISSPYFRSLTYKTLSYDDFDEHDLNESLQKIFASLQEYMREGSGWYVNKVLKLEVHSVIYKPIHGSAFLHLPESLARSRSVLNIQNEDNKCFVYCLLAYLHPAKNEPESVKHYLPYQHELNMRGINFPVTLAEIKKVEQMNKHFSINVFTYEENCIIPLRIAENKGRRHLVNLLLYKCGELAHYCLITDLNKFLSRTKQHKGNHFCHYCLHGFAKEETLQKHQVYCSSNGPQRVELPVPGENDILRFKDYEKTLKVPFVIYADFETINRKLDTCQSDPNQSSTSQTTKLEACSFGYKVVCEDERYTKPTTIFRGENAAEKFISNLLKEQDEIKQILSNIEPMILDEKVEDMLSNATHCCICGCQFTLYDRQYERLVRHHSHFTGKIMGLACNTCNINCKKANFIPVVFHNLKQFDSHILMQGIGQFKNNRLTCIAQNTEKYMSFSLDRLRFIDSLQFLPTSLNTLVDNLSNDGVEAFPHLLSETKTDANFLLRKGVFPYDYVDSFEKFEEIALPPKEAFYSSITKEHISQQDYEYANSVFERFNMSTLGDYHDLYLKTDVMLLSDVFESFRSVCLRQYGLDPCHFYTSPGLSWSACLKMTKIELELLTDIDKVLMVERGVRGGSSFVSARYKKANNPYLEDYDPSLPTSYLQYLDANNLYGWAMVQPLPVGGFDFLSEKEISLFDVMSVSEHSNEGFILEVSLHYPQELHDLHDCFPLAPIKRAISDEELSPYAQHLLRKLHGLADSDPLPNRGKVEKLLTTLEDKDHYVLHYTTLQLYLRLGMRLKTIHKVLKFRQEPWMKAYIDHNTTMRQHASSTFEKNFYKLMNVSVFGKVYFNTYFAYCFRFIVICFLFFKLN